MSEGGEEERERTEAEEEEVTNAEEDAAAAAAEGEEDAEEEEEVLRDRPDPAAVFGRSLSIRMESFGVNNNNASSHESSAASDSDAAPPPGTGAAPSSSTLRPLPLSRKMTIEEEEAQTEMLRTEMSAIEGDEALRQSHSMAMEEIRGVGSRSRVENEGQLDRAKLEAMKSVRMKSMKGVVIEEEEEGEEEAEETKEEGPEEEEETTTPTKKGKKKKKGKSKIGVFNANSLEGCSIVRTLAKQGCDVVAIVRVTTSVNVRRMVRLPNVTVVVADSLHDREAISDAIRGCNQVFYVLKYWEKFDGDLEEQQTFTIFDSCYLADVSWVVFTTYEEVTALKVKGKKSQIVPRRDGTVAMPSFAGLRKAKDRADDRGIRVTHMITSYIDSKKRSLTLIKGGEKLIVVANK